MFLRFPLFILLFTAYLGGWTATAVTSLHAEPASTSSITTSSTTSDGDNSSIPNQNCFTKHLLDAAQINSTRKSAYYQHAVSVQGKFFGTRSTLVSNLLIASEIMLYQTLSGFYDRTSDRIAKRLDFNVNCLGYVSMKNIGSMENLKPLSSEEAAAQPENFDLTPSLKKEIKSLRINNDLQNSEDLSAKINAILIQLKDTRYNCMIRHLLESTRRFAQIANAKKKYWETDHILQGYLVRKIKLHLSGVSGSIQLDALAYPLQKHAIPIICNDVPHIPEFMEEKYF